MSSLFNCKKFLFCIPLVVGNLTICAIYISFYITAVLCLIYEIVTSYHGMYENLLFNWNCLRLFLIDTVKTLKIMAFVVVVLPGVTSTILLVLGIFWVQLFKNCSTYCYNLSPPQEDYKYVNLHLNLSFVGLFMEIVMSISMGARDFFKLILLLVPGLHLYLWICIHEYYNLLIRQSRIQPPAEIQV